MKISKNLKKDSKNTMTNQQKPTGIIKKKTNHKVTFIIILITITIYEILTDVLGILDNVLFPGFSKIIPKFKESLPMLLKSLLSSSLLLFPSYFIALFIGISLGIIVGTRKQLYESLKPIIFALNPVPPSMLTPYLIAIMPTFFISSSSVIFLGAFWPIFISTINGIRMVDRRYLDSADMLGYDKYKTLFYVVIPAASPMILSGMGTALNFSFILLSIAELFATTSGLGYFIQYYADFSDYARVISGLIFTMIFIVIIMLMFDRFKKKILFWTFSKKEVD